MIKIRNISLFFILFIVAAPPAYSQVDIAGPWGSRRHEDDHERGEGPDIGDYSGLPINEAARFKADTWTATKWSVLEHQCEPHPSDYSPSFSSMLIYKEINEVTWETEAYKLVIGWMTPVRTIWMDGRPHPSENAPHTWEGFSTGEWHGDMLVVTTTHLKEGWIRRNGIPRSDSATLTEYFMRNGNYLTQVSIIEDPAYLTEPFIRSRDWELELGYQMTPYIFPIVMRLAWSLTLFLTYCQVRTPFYANIQKLMISLSRLPGVESKRLIRNIWMISIH